MKKTALAYLVALLAFLPILAIAQSGPGPVPDPWIVSGNNLLPGGRKVVTTASTTGFAGFGLLPGTAPSSPINGDLWMTSAGVFARVNGATVGPFIDSGSSSTFAATSPLAVTFPAGVTTYALNDAGVTYAKIQNLGALAVMGRSANASGVGADIQATPASDAVLRESGGIIGFGTIATGGIADNAVTLAKLATQATNTILGNATAGPAAPTALAIGTCSTSSSALNWTTNSGFGCNTSINAATLGGATFAAPGAIGGGTAAAGTFTALTGISGSITGLTGFAIRDASAAFDDTIAFNSSIPLSAGRTLTINVVNAARTLKLGANLTLASDPGGVTGALKSDGSGTFSQAACSDLSGVGTGCAAAAGITALTSEVTATGPGSAAASVSRTFSPTMTGNWAFNPTTGNAFVATTASGTLAQGLNITQNASGTATSPTWNLIHITGDNVNAGAGFANGLTIIHSFGNGFGGRQAFEAVLSLDAATNAANANRFYVAGVFLAQANGVGDGGGVGTEKGRLAALNPYVLATSGATNLSEMTGGEVNVDLRTGASSLWLSGWKIVKVATSTVQGSVIDAGLWFSNQTGATGWNDAIFLDNGAGGGVFPVKSTGNILRTGAGTFDKGFDLSASTITTAAFKSPGFTLGGTGDIVMSRSNAAATIGIQIINTGNGYASLELDGGGKGWLLSKRLNADGDVLALFNVTTPGSGYGGPWVTFYPSGGVAFNSATDPGAGSLQVNGNIFAPNLPTTTGALAAALCWTATTGEFQRDTNASGCLVSAREAKNIQGPLAPNSALDIVMNMRPEIFYYKKGVGDGGKFEQIGFIADEMAMADERLAIRDDDGKWIGVRYMQTTAALAGAIQQLKADNDNLRSEIASLKRVNAR